MFTQKSIIIRRIAMFFLFFLLPLQALKATTQELVVLGDLDMSKVYLSAGYRYISTQDLGFSGDISGYGTRSKLVLLEDGIEMGPAHSLHLDISLYGAGRFSHWSTALYFSASNNTDPRTNGKRYQFGIYADAGSNMQGVIRMSGVSLESGYCYITTQQLDGKFDTNTLPQQSIVRIFEDGIELSPAHSLHAYIRTNGTGRFSHYENQFGGSLRFSSSDNTDPRTNGRAYTFGKQELVVLGDLDMSNVLPSTGYRYVTFYQDFGFSGDISGYGQRSKLVLLEDGIEIGPAHSLASDISLYGAGRFSHWSTALHFSASNNTDPRTNGKRYQFGIYADAGSNMQGVIKMSGVTLESEKCYQTSQPLGVKWDTPLHPQQSIIRIFEDGKELKSAHSLLANIRTGGGNFSHSGDEYFYTSSLYFSSSVTSGADSNPITNGKAYTYGVDQRPDIFVKGTIPANSIGVSSGYCYYSASKRGIAPEMYSPYSSNLRLYEDGTDIGPAHASSTDMINYGLGSFNHWSQYLFFSADNNSNPQTNGKTYSFTGYNQQKVALVNTVQTQVTSYSTFASHNQKVVKNKYGIFITYVSTLAADGITHTWRLMRSTDNGDNFTQIATGTEPTNAAPTLETDESGRIFMIGSDSVANTCRFYRFDPSNNFASPIINTTFTGMGNLSKFCAYYDKTRARIYFMTYQLTGYKNFFVLDTNGVVTKSYAMASNAPPAAANIQYPHLTMSNDGKLFAAWTTSPWTGYHYISIHYAISDDGGDTWHKLDGTALTVPFVADTNGPTDMVNLSSEISNTRHNWLTSFTYKNNALHFMYRSTPFAPPPADPHVGIDGSAVHYVRVNLSSKTVDKNIYPTWQGTRLSLTGTLTLPFMDGFFVTTQDNTEMLYAVSSNGSKIMVLASADNGTTWFDWAESDKMFNIHPSGNIAYIGGYRNITDDGYIIGTFRDENYIIYTGYSVNFVKIKAF